MAHSMAEILVAYAFVSALFIGLPAIVLVVVFLPGLMRTTGETIGSHGRERNAIVAPKVGRVPTRQAPAPPLTMANTA